MSINTLTAIRNKVRRMTGSISTNQLTNADLDEYINTYYQLDFPSYLKLWDLHETYTFFTQPNEDQYTFPFNQSTGNDGGALPSFQAINPPIYIDGYQSWYSQSREQFFTTYPRLTTVQIGPAGDGTSGPYAFTIQNTPILKRNVNISAVDSSGITRVVEDDGNGNLVNGSSDLANPVTTGNINYTTGAVTNLRFRDDNDALVNIPTTSSIEARYVNYQASRPIAMLFYDNTMTLRPVPNKAYRVEVQVYKNPVQLIATSDIPELDQWWQLIAIGAARKVLQDRLDTDALASIEPFYQEQLGLAFNKTALQLAPQRTSTIYTDMLQYPIGNRPFGGF